MSGPEVLKPPKSEIKTPEAPTSTAEKKAGDIIDIMLGLAWMDKRQSPHHELWRDAIEGLVRKTDTFVVSLPDNVHHKLWAQRVKQALERINHAKRARLQARKRKASDLQDDVVSIYGRRAIAKHPFFATRHFTETTESNVSLTLLIHLKGLTKGES